MSENENGGADMKTVTLETARLNVWNVAGFGIGIAVTAFGWGIVYNTMQNADEKAMDQVKFVNEEIKDIKAALPAITQLQFQMTTTSQLASENKKAIEETAKRIDRVVESFGGKLDTVIDKMNKIATSVEVLASQSKEKPQPTYLRKQ